MNVSNGCVVAVSRITFVLHGCSKLQNSAQYWQCLPSTVVGTSLHLWVQVHVNFSELIFLPFFITCPKKEKLEQRKSSSKDLCIVREQLYLKTFYTLGHVAAEGRRTVLSTKRGFAFLHSSFAFRMGRWRENSLCFSLLCNSQSKGAWLKCFTQNLEINLRIWLLASTFVDSICFNLIQK